MMRKTNEGQSPVGILLPSVLAGLLGTLLLMLLGAVLIHRGTLAEGAIAPCALVFLALGSALAALVAAKRAGENQFYWSLGAGFAVFLILLIVAVLPLGQSIHFVRTVISLLCSLIASALGGYAGANMRKKKRYSHIKK
ncbi:putative membrane protein [uncultured Butyricicoccus sp.]|nr:putative membrane protein [uncultured Butyricicoccus sp.]